MSEVLLEASAIAKRFGGLQALKSVSLTIRKGEIYGLIGPNGAGKTTFFNCLTGLYSPSSGHIVFDGEQLPLGQPHLVTARGIARTFQNVRLFGEMTALENVMVGCHAHAHSGVIGALFRPASNRREEKDIYSTALNLLKTMGIDRRADDVARTLSYGDQRRVEIARALATRPKLLALDEPAAGMNNTETEGLRTLISNIRDQGTTVLLIEHDVHLVMCLCNRVAVLDHGELICEDKPDVVQQDSRVRRAYLGEDHLVIA